MKKHLRYLHYVILHKWYVWKAGRQFGHAIPIWRLIIHDYSKFSRTEWTPYVNRFFSGNAGKEDKSTDPDEFHRAWTHHWHNNPHHWEYWLRADGTPMKMPDNFVYEMIADWLGASKGITGSWDLSAWYEKTASKQRFHPETQGLVNIIMEQTVPRLMLRLTSKSPKKVFSP